MRQWDLSALKASGNKPSAAIIYIYTASSCWESSLSCRGDSCKLLNLKSTPAVQSCYKSTKMVHIHTSFVMLNVLKLQIHFQTQKLLCLYVQFICCHILHTKSNYQYAQKVIWFIQQAILKYHTLHIINLITIFYLIYSNAYVVGTNTI